jgi:2'-5' RNA ligase
VRLFTALELPVPVRAELARWSVGVAAATPGLRPLNEADLHVTLCFLGAQPESAVPQIASACASLSERHAAPLRLAAPLWLPRRAPRVLAVALDDLEGKLTAAQAQLSATLASGGWYVPERRRFLAHVTVARVRRGSHVRASPLAAPAALELRGRRVTLYRSHLGPAGARYEALATVSLDG